MRTVKLIVEDDRYGEEYKGTYVFKEISWGKANRINQQFTKYNRISGQVESMDVIAIQAHKIMASLHGQPDSHPLTLEKFMSDDGIPSAFGDAVSRIVTELNGIPTEDLAFLLMQLNEKDRTQLLANIGYVKSLDGYHLNSDANQQEKSKNLQ